MGRRSIAAGCGLALSCWALCCWAFCLPAAAWTPKSQLSIAESAALLAPPDLARLIIKHRKDFREGVLAAFEDGAPARHYKDADGDGTMDRAWLQEAQAALDAIEAHRPFAEVVFRLGVMSHYLADANNPLNASGSDRMEPRYFADFARYMESTEARLRPVFYGLRPELETAPSLAPLMQEALERSRRFYPMVGREYRRFANIDGRRNFDDRSTAFGVAALAYSHAVTDVTEALRLIWLRSGGSDLRKIPRRGEILVQVPRMGLAAAAP